MTPQLPPACLPRIEYVQNGLATDTLQYVEGVIEGHVRSHPYETESGVRQISGSIPIRRNNGQWEFQIKLYIIDAENEAPLEVADRMQVANPREAMRVCRERTKEMANNFTHENQ